MGKSFWSFSQFFIFFIFLILFLLFFFYQLPSEIFILRVTLTPPLWKWQENKLDWFVMFTRKLFDMGFIILCQNIDEMLRGLFFICWILFYRNKILTFSKN